MTFSKLWNGTLIVKHESAYIYYAYTCVQLLRNNKKAFFVCYIQCISKHTQYIVNGNQWSVATPKWFTGHSKVKKVYKN